MFRRILVLSLVAVGVLAIVADVEACHRCRGRRSGYGAIYGPGCGYYCHKPYPYGGGYRVVKVYRTVKVPVKTCTTSCVTTVDPCNPCCTTSTPVQTCTTTYVNQRVLVHSQVVPRGPVYGNYADGTRRMVVGGYGYGSAYGGRYGYGRGYGAPYRGGSLGGAYLMGGYGAEEAEEADEAASDYAEQYREVAADVAAKSGVAF